MNTQVAANASSTTTKPAHTPTPLSVEPMNKYGVIHITTPNGDGVSILASTTSEPFAELIVRAANSHAELIAALNLMVLEFADVVPRSGAVDLARKCAIETARSALAKAQA